MKNKVLFLGPTPPPYMGPSVATEIILASDLGNRYELILLDTSHHKDLSTINSFSLKNTFLTGLDYVKFTWKIITRWPAIVYIPISQTTIGYLRDSPFILIARLFRRPVVCHLRGGNFKNWYQGLGGRMRRYVKFIHGMVDTQIVLGEKLRHLFDDLTEPNRIFVIPNGRDFPWLDGELHKRDPQEPVRILYLSNFVRSKGIMDVLEAAAITCASHDNVEFSIAGGFADESIRGDILSFLEHNKTLPIRMLGTVSGKEKHELLNRCDVFVFPTYYPPEGHPWAIVEAMAAGMPVVSTDHAAITESVIDGVNGYIVAKRDPDSVAQALSKMIVDPQLLDTMSRASRRLYEENFTEQRLVERFDQVFSEVLGRHS